MTTQQARINKAVTAAFRHVHDRALPLEQESAVHWIRQERFFFAREWLQDGELAAFAEAFERKAARHRRRCLCRGEG